MEIEGKQLPDFAYLHHIGVLYFVEILFNLTKGVYSSNRGCYTFVLVPFILDGGFFVY